MLFNFKTFLPHIVLLRGMKRNHYRELKIKLLQNENQFSLPVTVSTSLSVPWARKSNQLVEWLCVSKEIDHHCDTSIQISEVFLFLFLFITRVYDIQQDLHKFGVALIFFWDKLRKKILK